MRQKFKVENDKVTCETEVEFELLEHNTIMDTFRRLYRVKKMPNCWKTHALKRVAAHNRYISEIRKY